MLKRLERDATKADLAAVSELLNSRTAEEDPIGHLQFSRRAEALAQKLRDLDAAPTTGAEIGLFFGGRPVIGSHGILADFGTKAVSEFQNIVSSTFAAAEGALGARGPVPQRDRTHLLLTDVARGSFGFILQAEEQQLIDSPMKEIVTRAADLVFRVATPDQEAFEGIADQVDSRVLGSLRAFFKVLDDAGATVRVVEDEREFTLQRGDIVLGRERTENASLEEAEDQVTGILYVLPAAKRFELHPEGGGDPVKGTITPSCLAELTGGNQEVRPGIIGTVQTVRIRVREIRSQGQVPKRSYALLSLIQPLLIDRLR
ncbi:hypothetical protein [Bosea thiooxidans]